MTFELDILDNNYQIIAPHDGIGSPLRDLMSGFLTTENSGCNVLVKISEERCVTGIGPETIEFETDEDLLVGIEHRLYRHALLASDTLFVHSAALQFREQTVLLVGSSGAGKTTVAHLLMRFWDPQAGTISLDGQDLREYRLDELRGKVSLVSQDTYLFNSSIRDNLLVANPVATESQIIGAATMAAAHEFIAALPDGTDGTVFIKVIDSVRAKGKNSRDRVSVSQLYIEWGDTFGNTAPTASFTYACTDLACSFDGSGSSDSDGWIYSWSCI